MKATFNFRAGPNGRPPPIQVECKISPLWWQKMGLSYTASGYGKRVPTQYMVCYNGKWRRVYCYIYSNAGTCYIGKWVPGQGAEITLNDTIEE